MKKQIIFVLVCIFTSLIAFVSMYKLMSLNKPTVNVHVVSLLKNKAEPDIVAIKTGDYVQFNSSDSNNHELEQGEGNANGNKHDHKDRGLGSGNFKADEGYKLQFKKEGIFFFHDHYNPDINITVVVKNKK